MKGKSISKQSNKKDKQSSESPLWEETAFRETADFIADGIFCLNTDGYLTFINRAGMEITGIFPDKFHSSHFLDFVHPAYRDLAIQNVHGAMAEGKDILFDLKLISADGQEKIIEYHTKAIRSGRKVIGLLVTARDTTERRRIEAALMASEEKYRLFMENANDAIIVGNADGYIQDVNKKAEELLGYSKEEFYTMHYSQFHLETERSTAAFHEIMDKKTGGMSNTLMLRKDGTIIPVDITSKCIEYGGQKVVRGSYRDISDHLKIKDDLERMVKERTAELDAKNEELSREVKECEWAEERIHNLYHQLVKSQELERQRISYDLHDNVAQDLFSLKIALDTLFDNRQCASAEIREKILKLSGVVKRVIASIRGIVYELSPQKLRHVGLLPTISRYCEDFSREYGLTVDFFPAGMDNLSMDFDIEITLYRILQECLNNVRKHANATSVTIKLVMSFPNIILRIKDNGKGFDVLKELAKAADNRHMGIQSMEERVAILKGTLRIDSRPMQGTEVMIEIPWRERKDERKENHLDN